ncbi:hypothetical protein FCM35_KLT08832 [Carex littledalei]|uniref:Uncharacterized protein n=1 Tax=Carex littledalei TaxID=544730 RepID=A0A833V620_9POAL|nr:hypothetical protein FCM35_KLT08832 [Carex littledalei]
MGIHGTKQKKRAKRQKWRKESSQLAMVGLLCSAGSRSMEKVKGVPTATLAGQRKVAAPSQVTLLTIDTIATVPEAIMKWVRRTSHICGASLLSRAAARTALMAIERKKDA